MRRFRNVAGTTILGVLRRRWGLVLLLGAPAVWICIRELGYYVRYTGPRWVDLSLSERLLLLWDTPPGHTRFSVLEFYIFRTLLDEVLLWCGITLGLLALVFLIAWLSDHVAQRRPPPLPQVDPDSLSLRNSTPYQAETTTPQQGADSMEHTTSRPNEQTPLTYGIVERPNQELVNRALNMYRDVMRSLLLQKLRQVHGHNVAEAVRASLSGDASEDFERDLTRNRGVLEATLDVGHFRAVVENNWDECFSTQFRHDRTVLGTMARVSRMRNEALHPGTGDLSHREAVAAINDIARVLEHLGATDVTQALAGLKSQVAVRSSGPASQETTAAQSLLTVSKCASNTCDAFNRHEMDGRGDSQVTCGKCSVSYRARTFDVVRLSRFREETQDPNVQGASLTLTVRGRTPDGSEDYYDFPNSPNIRADQGDTLTYSLDHREMLVYLHNHGIDRTWYFGGGNYGEVRQGPAGLLRASLVLGLIGAYLYLYFWFSPLHLWFSPW